ncbi:MAG: hypothetical protein K2Y14_10205 [Burkholderiales bacterium]|nr:hypothetical protein [Burkholderiales bacterium]
MRKQSVLCLSIMAIGLVACHGGTSSGGDSAPAPTNNTVLNAITIDSSSVIPVLSGASTKTVLYVHNNSIQDITGISYNSSNENNNNKSSNKVSALFKSLFATSSTDFINPTSATRCSSIKAGQSCALEINTPTSDEVAFKGSTAVQAKYENSLGEKKFTTLVNYASVDNTQTHGAVFSGKVTAPASKNTQYVTTYLYGTGSGQIHKIHSLKLDKSGFKITQGDVTGLEVQSNYVQAIEVAVPPSTNAISATITVQSSLKSAPQKAQNTHALNSTHALMNETYDSNSSIVGNSILPDGALLTVGQAPVINTSLATTGSFPMINSGNAEATAIAVTMPAGAVQSTGANACGSSLASNDYCMIYYTINSSHQVGQGNIIIHYTGTNSASITNPIDWYKTGAAFAGMNATPNSLTTHAATPVSTNVTVTNAGSYNFTNVTIPNPVITGNATASVDAGSCTGALAAGSSCTYSVTVSSPSVQNGTLKLGFSADYAINGTTATYSRVLPLSYSITPQLPSLSIAALTMNITGNNVESQILPIVISNNGDATATISGTSLINAPAYLTLTGTACTSIAAGASCSTQNAKLGPVIANTPLVESINYQANYSGTDLATTSATTNINTTVQTNTQSVSLSAPVVTNSASGDGSSATPYIFSGANTAAKTLTLTYINSGTNPVKITGITNPNSGYVWAIDTARSSCYVGEIPAAIVQPTEHCTVVFNSILNQHAIGLGSTLGASYTENVTLPTVTFQDQQATGTQFSIQPTTPNGETVVYATAQQATLSSAMSQAGANGGVTVTNTLANATGYASITATTQMEDYFTGSPTMTNCTQSVINGIRTKECTLSPSTLVGTGVYTPLSGYTGETLNAIYTVNTNNQVVSVTQQSGSLVLQ